MRYTSAPRERTCWRTSGQHPGKVVAALAEAVVRLISPNLIDIQIYTTNNVAEEKNSRWPILCVCERERDNVVSITHANPC